MRTQEEIIARAKEAQSRDMFGFEWHEYLTAMTRESVEGLKGTLVQGDADLSDWAPCFVTDDDLLTRCREYMGFAWEKANYCRGISAGRSLSHYRAWLWLLGRDDFEDIEDHEFYGKDELTRICEHLGIDAAKFDDGIRSNTEY